MNESLTEIAYILDRSGSMQPMVDAAVTGFNEFLQDQLDAPGEANLSLVLFDDEFLKPWIRTPLKEVSKLTRSTFIPRGCTALLDAIGMTIDELGKSLSDEPEEGRPGKVVVAIFTDGQENASSRYSPEEIHQMITHQRTVYQWEFLFLAANEDAVATQPDWGSREACLSRQVALSTGFEEFQELLSQACRPARECQVLMRIS